MVGPVQNQLSVLRKVNIPDVSAILQWALRYCTPAAGGAFVMWVLGLRRANLEIRRLTLENGRLLEDRKRSDKSNHLDTLSNRILDFAKESRKARNQTTRGVVISQHKLAEQMGEPLIDVATALTILESKALANRIRMWPGSWRILG